MTNNQQISMLNDKQIKRLLASAGKWFFLKYYDEVYALKDNKRILADKLFKEGHDSKITGTRTRINCMTKLIECGCTKQVLNIIGGSQRMLADHPETSTLIAEIYEHHPELG